jgi:hypothetical protein
MSRVLVHDRGDSGGDRRLRAAGRQGGASQRVTHEDQQPRHENPHAGRLGTWRQPRWSLGTRMGLRSGVAGIPDASGFGVLPL